MPANGDRLLDVQGLRKFFPIQRGLLRRVVGHVRAVDDVSFDIRRGQTLSLVGESGCGKTTTARCILRALPPTAGDILLQAGDGPAVNVARLTKRELRPLAPRMQMIFQEPFSSLNPRRTLLDIVAEPMVANAVGTVVTARTGGRAARLVGCAGVHAALSAACQRRPAAAIGHRPARSRCIRPRGAARTSRCRRSTCRSRRQILNLMLDLQAQLGLTYLFVAHDLSVVKHVSDRVA